MTAGPSPRYTAPRNSDRNSGARTTLRAQGDRYRGSATDPSTGSVRGSQRQDAEITGRPAIPSWRWSGVGFPNAVGSRAHNGQMSAHHLPIARSTPSQRTQPPARPRPHTDSSPHGVRRHLHHSAPGRPTDQDRPGTASPTRSSSEETHLWHLSAGALGP